MQTWLSVIFGIAGGLILLAAAAYAALRPYLKEREPKGWMPDPTGDTKPNDYAP